MLIDVDDLEFVRDAVKKLKQSPDSTLRRVAEGFEEALRALEQDPRGIMKVLDEIEAAIR